MLKPAFSTLACPNLTLPEVAHLADSLGYESVELRTFGDDSRESACDPALSSPEKIRNLFGSKGVEIAAIATPFRFDQIHGPPVLGPAFWDQERAVRLTCRAIDLAAALEAPFVRVFGFLVPDFDSRPRTIKRIADRLFLALDHAHRTGVRIVIENAGHFPTAADLIQILDACNHPLLGACYHNAPALLAGEDPALGVSLLADRLLLARVQDALPAPPATDASAGTITRVPCPLGAGDLHAQAFVHALAARNFSGPLVYQLDALAAGPAAPVQQWLADAAPAIFKWASSDHRRSDHVAHQIAAHAHRY